MQPITLYFTFLLLILVNTVNAQTYYVKNGGNDNANGKSDSTAWATISKVKNFNFSPGDDVYFKAGNKWEKSTLYVNWSGNATNRVVIGSYYMQDGKEKVGVPTNTNKPTFTGGYISSKSIGSVPSYEWDGLITIAADYVTIQNIRVQDSSGFGINLAKYKHHAIIENNEIDHVVGGLIFLNRYSYNSIVRKNVGWECAWSTIDNIKPWPTHPGCISAANSDDNVIENNTIHSGGGEGILAYVGADNNIIRGNTVIATTNPGIYIDNASNNLVENNILFGDFKGVLGEGKGFYTKGGISIAVEQYYSELFNSTNNIVKNNIISGVIYCLLTDLQSGAIDQGKIISFEFINNTCISSDLAIRISDADEQYLKSVIANNIFWDQNTNFTNCKAPYDKDISFSNNSWNIKPSDDDCNHTNDVIGNPNLTNEDIWGNAVNNASLIANDFVPKSTSPVLKKAAPISHVSHDYFGNTRPLTPAIGAAETQQIIAKPATPTGLKVVKY